MKMNNKSQINSFKKPAMVAAGMLLFIIATSSSCGDLITSPTDEFANTYSIGGVVVKGPVKNANVNVHSVNSSGYNSGLIGSTTTDSNGNWALTSDSKLPGIVRVEVTDGDYIDESDQTNDTNTGTFTALINNDDSAVNANANSLSVSPLTTFIDSRSVALIGGGASTTSAISTATGAITQHFGLTEDPLTVTINFDDTASVNSNREGTAVGLVIASFAQLAKDLGHSEAGGVIDALTEDIADGVFDGKDNGTQITYTDNSTNYDLNVDTGSSAFMTSMNNYIDSSTSTATISGISGSSETDSIQSEINSGISTSDATPPQVLGQINVSTSASAAIYQSGSTQKVYIAGKDKTKGLVIYNVNSDTASTLVIQDPALGSGCTALATTNCMKIDGLVLFSSRSLLVLLSYDSSYLVFIDTTTDLLASTNSSFDTGFTTTVSFSGGSALIAGAIGDNTRNGVWISGAGGYYFVDMSSSTYTMTNTFPLASGSQTSENFGANTADTSITTAGYLWAPNYSTYDFLDISSGTYYQADSTTASALGVSSPDHGAVDTKLNVGLITPEDINYVVLVDLNMATFNSTDKTFSIPASAINKVTFPENPTLSGVTVESVNHIAFMMSAFGNDKVAVAKLDENNVPQITDYIVFSPGAYNMNSDPHSVAIGVNEVGDVVGYLPTPSNSTWALNLTNLLDSTKYARVGGTNELSSASVTAAKAAGDIKSITY